MERIDLNNIKTNHINQPVTTTTAPVASPDPAPRYEQGTVPPVSEESKGERNARKLHGN